ncbi:MAG: ATP-binding cassette domain-containing protein [Solirubrobacterales bacterium]
MVALDDVSFDVAPGSISGFVGPNGAGKTTTMRIVLGVLSPDHGSVRWQGQALDAESRRRIGYMPEERGLYPKMAVGRQLRFFARLHGLEDEDAAASAEKWMDRLGIAERAGDPVEELSLGNQQRVQLAAALVHGPDLLVLDEPFSGLDPVGVEVLAEVLAAETRERELPVIFSSHQLELVERLCDSVAIIKAGRLVASGGVDELREQRSQNHWEVGVEGASGDWLAGIPGVRRVDGDVVELDDATDPQALLDRARSSGSVVSFGRRRPTLAELFREAVADEPEAGAREGK